ncbi:ABC transporter permease [Candidatus Bipolaricaulota bacterium]|nr:ABC transporter permease [Candidatus Bipolaricaulota bacterium]
MWKFIKKNKGMVIGGVIVTTIVVMAIFAPFVAPYSFKMSDLNYALTPPGRKFLLGTDQYGRDILSRLIYGARLSLMVGLIAQTINTLIGVTLGLFSGYYGGKIDDSVMGLTNIVLSMPVLILSLAIMAILGPGIINLLIALGAVGWTYTCRITRAAILSVREKDYIEAARALGYSTFRILRNHVLPNILGPILVIATLGVADVILTAATLSFLGLGAQPPTPEWGAMLSRGRDYLYYAPWISIFPGVALFITILGLNVLGDGLRDFLDPHLKTLK